MIANILLGLLKIPELKQIHFKLHKTKKNPVSNISILLMKHVNYKTDTF